MANKPDVDATHLVAYEITRVSGNEENGQEAFEALDEETQALMLELAHAAMMAHQIWLADAGFRIIPPGMTVKPQSEAEAHSMAQAVRDYLDQPLHAANRRKGLLKQPAIILPFNATKQ